MIRRRAPSAIILVADFCHGAGIPRVIGHLQERIHAMRADVRVIADKSGTIGVDSSSAFRVGNGSQNKVRAVIRIGVSVVIVGNGLNASEAAARDLNDDRYREIRPVIPDYVEPRTFLCGFLEAAIRAVIQLGAQAVWVEHFSRLVIPIAAGEMNRATVSEIEPKLGPILGHIV